MLNGAVRVLLVDDHALVLHARLLLEDGDVPLAVAQYKLAIDADPAVADEALAELNAAVFDVLPDSVVDLWYRFVPGYGRMG